VTSCEVTGILFPVVVATGHPQSDHSGSDEKSLLVVIGRKGFNDAQRASIKLPTRVSKMFAPSDQFRN
jgi:hypothetical protein